jgi:hypothetical protein
MLVAFLLLMDFSEMDVPKKKKKKTPKALFNMIFLALIL